MQVMTFGSTCSPSCAQAVKNHNAERFSKLFPVAAEAIKQQHYVDDYLDSFTEFQWAKEIVRQVIEIHDHAGFHIRNFISNNKKLLQKLPSDRVDESIVKLFKNKDSATEKVLGVYWNTKNDSINYQIELDSLGINLEKQLPTKREVLSFMMSIYDPLGLISNITIHGRILMQKLHMESVEWDREIPYMLQSDWHQWIEMIKSVENVRIPSHMLKGKSNEVALHTFVDASDQAFAACVYIRSIHENNVIIRLVTA